jgi:hypothetical protein
MTDATSVASSSERASAVTGAQQAKSTAPLYDQGHPSPPFSEPLPKFGHPPAYGWGGCPDFAGTR